MKNLEKWESRERVEKSDLLAELKMGPNDAQMASGDIQMNFRQSQLSSLWS